MDTNVHAGAVPAEIKETKGLREKAQETKQSAREVLGGHSGGISHRLILTLAVIMLMTVSIALYAAVSCFAMAGWMAYGDALWVDVSTSILLLVLLVVLAMPLAVSLERLACLMAAPDGETTDGLPVSVPTPDLLQFFYPFTSLRAYGRTMAVGMEKLALLFVGAELPYLIGQRVWISMEAAEIALWIRGLVMVGVVMIGIGWGFGILLLSGRRMGFSYFVFVHEELSLSDANRYFCTLRRPLLPALCLRGILLGTYVLSALAICVPFVFHSIPMGLCCKAVYGRNLTRSRDIT